MKDIAEIDRLRIENDTLHKQLWALRSRIKMLTDANWEDNIIEELRCMECYEREEFFGRLIDHFCIHCGMEQELNKFGSRNYCSCMRDD